MPRFRVFDSASDDDDGSSRIETVNSSPRAIPTTAASPRNDTEKQEDVETENEPPHPIGFLLPLETPSNNKNKQAAGRSRYNLNFDDDDEDWLEQKVSQPPVANRQQLPISAYLQTSQATIPMRVLIKDAFMDAAVNRQRQEDDEEEEDEDGLDGLLDTMQAIALSKPSSNITAIVPRLPAPQDASYSNLGNKERQIHDIVAQKAQRLKQDNKVLSQRLKLYIDKERQEAERILAERKQLEKEEQERVAQEAQEKEAERLRQEEKDAEKKRQDEIENKAKAERDAKQKAEDEKVAKKRADEDRKKKEESNFIERSQKLVTKLELLRQSVEPFDKSKPMAKRRLAMKKIVNGRVNTLSEDVTKVLAVAADVNQAIATARQDDAAIKAQIEAGNTQYSPEMALGKRYFLDLLSSKVIVRVQAEGFNGQRGDGFPLANMLAHVAKENTDFVPIMQAHVFKVCPTAIPSLPTPSENASEDELMESLGMIKGGDGSYETFERFLSRTEGIISIVADIMASLPDDHTLFQGSAGAIKWLNRFLQQLPAPPQSPLPLLTAPVLDAFLTGAGHMLANCYGDEFQKLVGYIEKDVMPRLDEGNIGAPSALRLRKTMKDGFDGFKINLPGRALKDLYRVGSGQSTSVQGATQTANQSLSAANPFGPSAQTGASTSNPFGGTMSAAPSPFIGGSGPSAAAPSQFGSTSNSAAPSGMRSDADTKSAFNSVPNTSAASPFRNSGPLASPFAQASAPSPFPSTAAAPSPSPFGNVAAAPSSFATTVPGPSPFGAPAPGAAQFGSPTPGAAPFGAGNTPGPSPFGAPPASGSSPFGGGNAPTPSPFGTSSQTPAPFGNTSVPAPSPFGSAAQSPFGASNAPGPSPFGSNPSAPTPFSSGPSSFGAPAPAPSLFGSGAPSPSPFGGTAAPAPTPFSSSGPSPSPFGVAPAPTPFGAATPATTPFGGGGMSSPFGSTAPSPFGSFSAAPAPTPFSGTNSQQGGFSGVGNNKAPCKYFAKGQCKFGNNCKYSHSIQPSSTSFSSPFGPPRR